MQSGSLLIGLLNGLLIGLLAVGLVIVYKANRFLNLAQGQLGALPALLLGKLVLDWGWSWWAAFVVAVTIGAATGLGVDRFLVRPLREASSSRVSLLLLSVGASQILLALLFIPALGPNPTRLSVRGYPVPFHTAPDVGGVILTGQYILIAAMVPVLIIALTAFLRYSTLGKAIRAAASNPDEARLCGISVRRVSAVTWALAGGLSAITAVLQAPSEAQFDAASLGPDLLLLALGAAAVGAFVSIPAALAGGLIIGVADQITLSATDNAGDALLVVVAVILATILARGKTISRVFDTGGAFVDDLRPVVIPAAARRAALVRHHRPLFAFASAAVAVLLPLLPYFRSDAHRFELVLILIYALVGVGLTILTGWAGQVSLGQFAIVGIGSFLTARLAPHGLSLPLLLFVAGAAGAAALVIVGLPALRVRGLTLAVTSLGLAVVCPEWLFNQHWFAPGGYAVDVAPPLLLRGLGRPASELSLYMIALFVLAVVMAAARGLRRSAAGLTVVAVRDNERAAGSFGLTPAAAKLTALAVSGFLAGVAGVLWAVAWQTTNSGQFSPYLSIALLAIPVVGGMGSVPGAVAATAVIYLPTFFLSPALSGLFGSFGHQVGFQLGLSGLGLIIVLLAYPKGLAGLTAEAWQRFVEKVAQARSETETAARSAPPLEVSGVDVSFGGLEALSGVAIEVRAGEIVGLIGPNGAGKTTLLNVISGTLAPKAGSVKVFGAELAGLPAEYRIGFGLSRSFQDARLFPGLTVRETLRVALSSSHKVGAVAAAIGAPWVKRTERQARAEVERVVNILGLDGYADMFVSDLSTGTRRICDLAAQLTLRPKVLLLDEPTAGLAQRESESFGPLLRRLRAELDCSILIIEHDMPLLMGLCDRVYVMESGRVLTSGTPKQVQRDPAVIASYLGTDPAAVNRSATPRRRAPARSGGRTQ